MEDQHILVSFRFVGGRIFRNTIYPRTRQKVMRKRTSPPTRDLHSHLTAHGSITAHLCHATTYSHMTSITTPLGQRVRSAALRHLADPPASAVPRGSARRHQSN